MRMKSVNTLQFHFFCHIRQMQKQFSRTHGVSEAQLRVLSCSISSWFSYKLIIITILNCTVQTYVTGEIQTKNSSAQQVTAY